MNALIRPALLVAVVFLLAVCIFGLRFACDPADLRVLIRGVRRGQELGRLQYAANRHLESKYQYQLVRELIAQRCSLSEALGRLQELDREWLQELERDLPDCTREMRKVLTQMFSDPEYYHVLITKMVESFLDDRPEEKEAVLYRLEKDYQQFRASSCRTDFQSVHYPGRIKNPSYNRER
jgi:hypothetical protein